MTPCSCSCSTFGPDTHDAEARHPNPKACIHADLDPRPELDKIIDPSLVPYPQWRDEDGSIYFTIERKP